MLGKAPGAKGFRNTQTLDPGYRDDIASLGLGNFVTLQAVKTKNLQYPRIVRARASSGASVRVVS